MRVVTIIGVIAVIAGGLLAGIYLGDRAGATFARAELSPSSFIQFQHIQHIHFAKFMPFLALGGLVATLLWAFMLSSHWRSVDFWLVSLSVGALLCGVVLTRVVNLPLNDLMMTWSVTAPPADVRELWAPWERVHTIRTTLSVVAFALQAVALGLQIRAVP